MGPSPEGYTTLKVSDLLLPDTAEWNVEKIEQILPFHSEQILKLQPSKLRVPDELVWLKNPNGEYSTRSGYRAIMEEKLNAAPMDRLASVNWSASVWSVKTTKKIKTFIWKSLHGGLPVGEQFALRNIQVNPLCVRCNAVETIPHLLFQCPYAAKVWDLDPVAT